MISLSLKTSVYNTCYFLSVVTVETGFIMNTLTVNENANSVYVCLATLGNPVMDTIVTVTVIYGSAGEEGELYDGSSLTL